MYENHAAREDTIVFPAWKKNFSDKQLDEISEQFETLSTRCSESGFEEAEKTISAIESALGLDNLAKFTAPAPPKV